MVKRSASSTRSSGSRGKSKAKESNASGPKTSTPNNGYKLKEVSKKNKKTNLFDFFSPGAVKTNTKAKAKSSSSSPKASASSSANKSASASNSNDVIPTTPKNNSKVFDEVKIISVESPQKGQRTFDTVELSRSSRAKDFFQPRNTDSTTTSSSTNTSTALSYGKTKSNTKGGSSSTHAKKPTHKKAVKLMDTDSEAEEEAHDHVDAMDFVNDCGDSDANSNADVDSDAKSPEKKSKPSNVSFSESDDNASSASSSAGRNANTNRATRNTNSNSIGGRPKRAGRKSYIELSSDSESEEFSEEEEMEIVEEEKKEDVSSSKRKRSSLASRGRGGGKKKQARPNTKSNKVKRSKTRRAHTSSSDEEDYSDESMDDDDDLDSDEFEMEVDETDDEEGFVSDESEFEEKPGKRRKGGAASTSTSSRKKAASTAKKGAKPKTAAAAAKPKGKSMAESFKPINAPIYSNMSLEEIHEQREFFDPCGMEASDDIIEGKVGEQLEKIGGLLLRSMGAADEDDENHKNGIESVRGFGSKENPLMLGTACSGTDAPALFLNILMEQMEKRGLTKDNGKIISFEHTFSCEVEPFKQGYLARNFDSVLYPDICKLTDKPAPVDVYGQRTKLPAFNMFVAGTSCKNFSMLRSNRRIDIEDKGCSGETFLAACEVLFEENPEIAIFENVQNAPWAKMSEYITGRIKLSSCDAKKGIANVKDKGKDLTFVYEGGIIVDKVPGVYGIRAGAKVNGFLKGSSKKVLPIKWPEKSSKKGTCTLDQLMKVNGISKKDDTLVLDTPCTYCTKQVTVDTKQYGLPQTRNRGYMFVWRPENDDVHDDLGIYFEAIVEFLKAPCRHSLEAFMLNDDHDIIRRFREGLNGPDGRKTFSQHCQESDFWTSKNANLPHNVNCRKALGLEDMARTQTKWGPFGVKQLPPHYWLEYINCYQQRKVDLIDILHASALRDAESHDSNFSSFFWNVSQNASKEKHRTAYSGVAGCITPGGDFLIPHRGRPLLGCEKLLVQGLPYFRLALGNETEVQLGDLAGNAMSLTVVAACMLGSIMCKQLKKECNFSKSFLGGSKITGQAILNVLSKTAGLKGTVEKKTNIPLAVSNKDGFNTEKSGDLFRQLAGLANAAILTSIHCTSESSGRLSSSDRFVQCKICRVSVSRDCLSEIAGYNLESHDTEEITIPLKDRDPGPFRNKLRSILPATLFFNKDGLEEIDELDSESQHKVSSLSGLPFSLHQVKRDSNRWIITYYARYNGVGEAVGEARITIGELKKLDKASTLVQDEEGMMVELTSYLPTRVEPCIFGKLAPFAVKTIIKKRRDGAIIVNPWKCRTLSTTMSLTMEGEGITKPPRVAVGLEEEVEEELKGATKSSHNSKKFSAARSRGESRRWLYAKNWTKWPKVIKVTSDEACGIDGSYERADCEHTMNMNALWIRKSSGNEPTMYILIKPNVVRTGPVRAIISTSMDYDDSHIVASLPTTWQPCDALTDGKHTVNDVEIHAWENASKLECNVQLTTVSIQSKTCLETDDLMTVTNLTERQCNMLCQRVLSDDKYLKLPVHDGQKAQQIIRVFNAICATSIQQFIASKGLNFGLQTSNGWNDLSVGDSEIAFGLCDKCVPPRPQEQWVLNKERGRWERTYENGSSRQFRIALDNAPTPFEFWVDRTKGSLDIKFNPKVAGHYVARQMIDGRQVDAKDISVQFHFTDTMLQEDPVINPFKVKSCDDVEPVEIELKAPYSLYERQKRVCAKMIQIENGETDFEELEMIEHTLYGSTGLGVTTQAKRPTKLRGGVIADAIGAGKTIVSIAIILNGLKNARSSKKGPNSSAATLVVVPPALLDQWKKEIEKFSPVPLKVTVIYDTNTLLKISVQKMLDSDIVIVPIDVLESKGGYFTNLEKKANVKSGKEPKLPTHSGQKEVNNALGVWIPSSSADPYAGTNNTTNQQNRNISAYYTYRYQTAISALRKKSFKGNERGVPLEYFEWERVIVDEIHESLCTTKAEIELSKDNRDFFKEKNRRAGREFLGATIKDLAKRPVVYRNSIFGLTGTPLLDSTSRVIELAHMIGNHYVLGLSSHWRKLEKESCRDIFLENYLEPARGREVRAATYIKCQEYLDAACCRNKVAATELSAKLMTHKRSVSMSEKDLDLYLKSMQGIPSAKRSISIQPEDFDEGMIGNFLRHNACQEPRGKELVRICKEILDKDPKTKIIVFADGSIGAGDAACKYLRAEKGLGCTSLDPMDSNEVKNEKISWYQNADATKEDKARPRILVLHFEHCAGLNLQTECNNLILFSPLYGGTGGTSCDTVGDVSTELQAIGRVYRAGQKRPEVNLYKIVVEGPDGEEALDGQILRRNNDVDNIAMATNASD